MYGTSPPQSKIAPPHLNKLSVCLSKLIGAKFQCLNKKYLVLLCKYIFPRIQLVWKISCTRNVNSRVSCSTLTIQLFLKKRKKMPNTWCGLQAQEDPARHQHPPLSEFSQQLLPPASLECRSPASCPSRSSCPSRYSRCCSRTDGTCQELGVSQKP